MNENGKSTSVPGDNPIRDQGADVLERRSLAATFARQVLNLDASEGAAVGVFGPWGSGKTSFLNLARKTFENKRVPVLDFNPWLFSGAEQLVGPFFAELSVSMGMKAELKEIGKVLHKYGTAISAVSGVASAHFGMPWIGALVKPIVAIAGKASQSENVGALRKRLEITLRKRDKPIVVVLDDVDRLTAPEIREVFKLVRLTASFPNLIYIVSCDRLRVEQALGEQGLSGRDYLEKIIQWPFNLPETPSHLLAPQLSRAIEDALATSKNPGPFHEDVWDDVHSGILRPLIRNMRDVRRFAMAIRETVGGLEGQVARVDLLALEAIRVFLPDVFRLLPGAIDGLSETSRPLERGLERTTPQGLAESSAVFKERRRARVNGLIEAAVEDREGEAARTAREVIETMIDRLFPAGARLQQTREGGPSSPVQQDVARHLTERRVAHEHVLRLYLERVAGPDLLVFHDAERALARMTDRERLDEFIRSLEPTRWQPVVWNLCNLADRFLPRHVEPGVVVLLNLWTDMPERPSGSSVLGADPGRAIREAVRRLLRVLDDPAAVEAAVRRILPKLTSHSSKMELVQWVGQQDTAGRRLVSETAANEFEKMLQNEIQAAPSDDLAEERGP